MMYEVRDGDEWGAALSSSGLSELDCEILREAIDWTLSRNPAKNHCYTSDEHPISIYFEFFRARNGKYYIIFYRIEGNVVILETLEEDISQNA